MRFISAIAMLLLLLPALAVRADIIHLDDGTRLEGTVTKTADGWIITTTSGISMAVKADKVISIEASRSSSADTGSAAADRLASLRRVADNMTDIHQIIDRYEKFIAQNPGSSVLDDANKDLFLWHDRLDKSLVKIGPKWVTPEERDEIQAASQALALQAHDLIRQNRLKDAEPLLQKAITDDPESATAIYLRGVLLYNQEQVSQAKKMFETANEIAPAYAPTLNNLAVIAWRQKSFVAAMNFYDQAMLASPQARQVLDNVAEAFHALPDENKEAPAVKKCAAHFQDQDTALQQTAAQQGWYRWGSTWVSAKQLDDLKAAEQKIQAQLDLLNKDGDATRAKISGIDAETDANQRSMDRLAAASIAYDANGNQYQLPLPAVYYNLQRDNAKLAGDKKVLQLHIDDLKTQYKQIESTGPMPRFNGLQQLIGIDAAPVRGAATPPPPPAPVVAPASQPSRPSALHDFGPATQP